MKRIKKFLAGAFCLPPLPTVLISVPAYVLVIFALSWDAVPPAAAYFSYALSAYAVIITVTGFSRVLDTLRGGIVNSSMVKRLAAHPLARRLFDDIGFRSGIALAFSSLINLAYAAVKLPSGVLYRSSWFIALAGYYVILLALRIFLLSHVSRGGIGQRMATELKRCRLCGVLLLLMTQALAVITGFMVWEDRSFVYPGLLIYLMAAYSFYAITLAIINSVKSRKYGSPVLSAVKAVNLTAAMVSILSLETALISQFGGAEEHVFRRVMTGATGGCICAVVLTMAIIMTARSSRRLKQLKGETCSNGQNE
ncbi:MAG: hypothetical protein LIO57_04855 [Oscillospiraceae bacterium]|nr:hypothetical protein [Oscillospiraceae bacterium]